jgi:hypothetical protein
MTKHVPTVPLRGEALDKAVASIMWPLGHPTDTGRPQCGLPRFGFTSAYRWNGSLPPRGLPYGWWFLQDGSEVVFNRDYLPQYRVWPDGRVERADPTQFYEFIIQCWFWQDGCGPYDKSKEGKRRREIMQAVADDLAERCEPVAFWEKESS